MSTIPIQDYKAWFEKYRPRLFEEMVFPNEDIKDTLKGYYDNGFIKGNILSYGPPGFGKAQPNSEPVLTPNGWIPMGKILPGDYLINRKGEQTKVLNIFPQGPREIYEITFADGNTVRCDGDHIWHTWQNSGNKKKIYQNRTTKEMLNYKYGLYSTENTKYDTVQKCPRWSVPLPEPIVFNNDYTPDIHPYVLGLLLGDGSFRGMGKKGNQILFSDKYRKNLNKLVTLINRDFKDLEVITYNEKDFILQSKELSNAIRNLGLDNKKSIDKFIPENYLYLQNPLDRKLLFDGLMATDSYKCGDTNHKKSNLNSHEYYTSSKKLIDGFLHLVESLGIYHNPVRINSSPKFTYKGILKTGAEVYSVVINTKKSRKSIKDIKKLNIIEESTCVMVDDKEHLYITTGFTVTHNTSISEVMIHKIINNANDIFILGRKTEDVDNLKRWLQQRPVSSTQKVVKIEEMDRLSSQAQVVLKDGLMEKYQHNTTFLATTNSPEKIDPALITRFNTRINFGELPYDVIQKRLSFILDEEKIKYNQEQLLKFVNDYGKRGLRDLINNLELASTSGSFKPEVLDSFIGSSGNEDLIVQYMIYLIQYTESLKDDLILKIIKNPRGDAQFNTYYDYMLQVFKNELRLNYHSIYKELFNSELDFSQKNIVEKYWQDLDLKRFKSTHTIALLHELLLNIKEQKGL